MKESDWRNLLGCGSTRPPTRRTTRTCCGKRGARRTIIDESLLDNHKLGGNRGNRNGSLIEDAADLIEIDMVAQAGLPSILVRLPRAV
ncbi:MAG TPA: hypothetical protein VNH11_06770 [Pirellulales bacterium]|nr:hypothetical protein [Pirellulales bacterium]